MRTLVSLGFIEMWKIYLATDDVTKEVTYVKVEGYYRSYNGATYTGYSFVRPYNKVVTDYQHVASPEYVDEYVEEQQEEE